MPEHTSADDGEPFAGTDGRAADGEPDYYSVLGVRPGASDDEIRHAFHRLAKLWHPDRYMAAPAPLRERAERRMRALIAAHEVLGDPVRRHVYDRRYGHPAAALHAEHLHEHAGSTPVYAHAGHMATATAFTEGIQDAPATTGNPNGAGQFFGLICSFLALGILVYQLRHGDGSFGSMVGIGAVLMLGGLAVWFFVEGSPPSRMATNWLEGIPTARAAGAGAHYRKPHHRHRHGGHRVEPEEAPPAQPETEEQTPGESQEAPPTDFERLVEEALAGIPAEFQRYMENVAVRVQAEPSEEDLATVGVREGGLLLGLYHGVALTHQHAHGSPAPEEITIYQRPIERYCHHDPARIRDQVRRTVLHELAHHFGIDHEDMPDWVR
jgi:predicted Zn-dependent protease with MMP-like domain